MSSPSKRRYNRKRRQKLQAQAKAWRKENPTACCLTCVHREAPIGMRSTHTCALGEDKGGWYTPVKDEHYCIQFETAPLA